MRTAPLVLILLGVLLALSNLGVLSGEWMAPAVLIGIGCIALLFPSRWRTRHAERLRRRADRLDRRDEPSAKGTGSSV